MLFHIRRSFSTIMNGIGQRRGRAPGKGGEVRRFKIEVRGPAFISRQVSRLFKAGSNLAAHDTCFVPGIKLGGCSCENLTWTRCVGAGVLAGSFPSPSRVGETPMRGWERAEDACVLWTAECVQGN